jgi:hypothetical protein
MFARRKNQPLAKMLQFTGKNKEQTGLTAANPKKPADCFQSAGLRIEFR